MKKILPLFIGLGLLLMAFTNDGSDFKLAFTPPAETQYIKFYLDIVKDGKLIRDSADLQDGKLNFSGKVETPTKATLILVKLLPDGRKGGERVDLILEPAGIQIDASKGLNALRFSGSTTQDQYNAWNSGLQERSKWFSEQWKKVDAANKSGDAATEKALRAEIQVKAKDLQAYKEQFFEKNPHSLVTALLLEDYTGPVWMNLQKAKQVYDRLSPELKALPALMKFEKGLKIALMQDVGQVYPELVLPDSTGKMIDLAAYKGKYVLLDYWASWCGPCRAESPALVAAYNKYKAKGFEILSVSFDEKPKAWLQAVAKDGYTWGNVIDSTGMGPKGIVSTKYNIKAIPRNFLIDPQGKVVATNLRGEALAEKLKEIMGG